MMHRPQKWEINDCFHSYLQYEGARKYIIGPLKPQQNITTSVEHYKLLRILLIRTMQELGLREPGQEVTVMANKSLKCRGNLTGTTLTLFAWHKDQIGVQSQTYQATLQEKHMDNLIFKTITLEDFIGKPDAPPLTI